MKVVIVKYNAGNIYSVQLALRRLGQESLVSDDIETIKSADKVIFPGVGEARSAMTYLKKKGIAKIFPELKQPVLGICLGLQLMCQYSEENDTRCLGIFNIAVKKFPSIEKVPHMGWNTINKVKGNLFNKVQNQSFVYFVHSYYAELSEFSCAITEYILPFSAAIQKGNFFAVQFHPERSSTVGEQILKNFLTIKPTKTPSHKGKV